MTIQGSFVLKVGKSRKGNKYVALGLDMGYTVKFLCFDIYLISAMVGVAVPDLYNLDYGLYPLT